MTLWPTVSFGLLVEVQLHFFLTFAIRLKWLVTVNHQLLYLLGNSLLFSLTGRWMVPRATLDIVAHEKSFHHHWELNIIGCYSTWFILFWCMLQIGILQCKSILYILGNLNKFLFKIHSKSVKMVVRNMWPQS